jgi:hypothetical protein
VNDRIKELLKESGLQPYYDAQEGQIEKFALLIVRECANIVNSLEQYEGKGDCSMAEYMKEHFGVE